MNLIEANRLVYSLVAQHLPGQGWRVKWDNARGRNGQCQYGPRVLSFSEPLTRIATEAEFTNTVLHEIAHALVGPGHGHGQVWKNQHRAIGGSGQRCTPRDPEAMRAMLKWEISCVSCSFKTGRNRLTASVRQGGRCPECRSGLSFRQLR